MVARHHGQCFSAAVPNGKRALSCLSLLQSIPTAACFFEASREIIHGGRVSKVEMATPIDLIYKVLLPSISTFETPPASLWISMPPSHRLPSRLIPASGARPRGARPRERD